MRSSLGRWLRIGGVLAMVAILSSVALGDYSDLIIADFSFSGNVVTVEVHNPLSEPETARVKVTVDLVGLPSVTGYSDGYTVNGGDTITTTVTFGAGIEQIIEDPAPFPG